MHSASANYADFRRFKDKEKYRVGPSEISFGPLELGGTWTTLWNYDTERER